MDLYIDTANLQEIPRSEIIHPQLTMNMPMDEGTGSTTTGTTSFSHEGSLDGVVGKGESGPAWTTGQNGAALHFEGDHWVSIESTSGLQIAGSFTLEAWVRRYSGVSGDGTILSKGRSNHRNYQMLLLENGRVQFKWEVSGGANRGVTSIELATLGFSDP